MDNEQKNETNVNADPTERVEGTASGGAHRQPANAAPVSPAATQDFTDPAKHR